MQRNGSKYLQFYEKGGRVKKLKQTEKRVCEASGDSLSTLKCILRKYPIKIMVKIMSLGSKWQKSIDNRKVLIELNALQLFCAHLG